MLNTATTWAKKLWHWLTSMRTALMLLFLLALIAVPGALLPQREISESQVNEYLDANPVMGNIYDKLMLFDVFSSPVFVALLTLLVISLVGCIIPRSVDHYKAYNAKPTRAPKYLHRMPHHASATTGMSVEEATARTERTLRKWRVAHYKPEEDRAGVLSISAERGYARELANLLFHISIVALIAIFAYGRANSATPRPRTSTPSAPARFSTAPGSPPSASSPRISPPTTCRTAKRTPSPQRSPMRTRRK